MPSFVGTGQLDDQAALREELGPYLEQAWRRVREECEISPDVQAKEPSSASTASGSTPTPAPAPTVAAHRAHKPLVPMGHFSEARVKAPADSGARMTVEDFLADPQARKDRKAATVVEWEAESLLQAPRMSIAILVVGTRGDVQPFLRLGQRLKADGHRVRLATHNQYESYVRDNGLEFYPLGGDPKKLSGYMCQSNGRLMPNILSKEERNQIPEKMNMLEEMMFKTWPAVSLPYPEDGPLFHADAVIANPVAYGHVHVAEKLDVPVHLMFPQPWSPTGDLPHPLSILGGGCGSRDYRPEGIDAAIKRAQNLSTYYAIDEFLYAGMRYMTNDFRKSIGLEKIRAGEDGAHIINTHEVPFAYQWSPLLLPRPRDYGPHLEVTGTIFNEEGSSFEPPPELEAFLKASNDEGKPPVFVGFGSMMIAEPEELAETIIEAAKASDTRVILQSSWSSFHIADGDEAAKLVFQLGNCPHDWLFKQVAAVVHHGGAGTAAAGIRAGIPTLICPFFGDQHLWAQAFVHEGLAVEPCPIQDLTPEVLAAAFRTLRGLDEKGAEMRRRCAQIGRQLQEEDGVAGGVDCFYRHLPLEGLVCDASLMLGPERDVRMARWFSPRLGLKLCPEAFVALREELSKEVFDKCDFQRYHYSMAWGFSEPVSFMSSVSQGWRHLWTRYAQAGVGLIAEPVKGGFQGGMEGGVIGALSGGLRGTARGVTQGFHHVKWSTRRLILRPLKRILGTANTQGGRTVHADEVGLHSYMPDRDLGPGERGHFLEACKAVQALHQTWVRHAPCDGRPGERGSLPLKTVAALMLDMQYPPEVLDALALQYGMTVESEESVGEEETKSEERRVRRLQLKVSCFSGQKVGIPKRRDAGSHSIFESEKPLSFEEVATFLQPHGTAPRYNPAALEELVRGALQKRAS